MISRRTFLGGAAATLAAVPLATTSLGRRAAAAATLPMTVVNHTDRYANADIWMYVVGTDLSSHAQVFLAPDGTLTPVSSVSGTPDLSIPLAADGDTTIDLPDSLSGRVYFALGSKLTFKVVTDGNGNAALQYPAGWVSSDPSYQVMHDWIEFTRSNGGMFCNTTMVDQFSVPLAIALHGSTDQSTGALVSGGRDQIFTRLAANPDFAPLIVGDRLRVIAPGHGIDTGVFSSTYLDSAISAAWDAYTSRTLTVDTGSATYTGQVSGGRFTFSGGVAPFAKPSTQNVFYCNGALAAPNDGVTGPVAAILGAALNRSTLRGDASQPATDPAAFYGQAATNHYAQAMHAASADGKAYGFPFDDVAGFAPTLQDGAPSAFTVTLTPF